MPRLGRRLADVQPFGERLEFRAEIVQRREAELAQLAMHLLRRLGVEIVLEHADHLVRAAVAVVSLALGVGSALDVLERRALSLGHVARLGMKHRIERFAIEERDQLVLWAPMRHGLAPSRDLLLRSTKEAA